MLAGMVGGLVMDLLHAARWLQPFLREALQQAAMLPGQSTSLQGAPGLRQRHAFAWGEMTGIFRRVWLWVVAGVGLGAALHGYVPQQWFAEYLDTGQWWSVPAVVAVGIPLYTNVTGIIPVMESLLLKGLPLGTTMAFCMNTVAASLPEVLMLKQVMRWQLLLCFLGILLLMFTLVGWLFNGIQLQHILQASGGYHGYQGGRTRLCQLPGNGKHRAGSGGGNASGCCRGKGDGSARHDGPGGAGHPGRGQGVAARLTPVVGAFPQMAGQPLPGQKAVIAAGKGPRVSCLDLPPGTKNGRMA